MSRPRFQREITIYGSGVLSQIQYDPKTSTLDVKLHSGLKYRYSHVSARDFAKLVTANSGGKVYNKIIKANYLGKKLPSPRNSFKPIYS